MEYSPSKISTCAKRSASCPVAGLSEERAKHRTIYRPRPPPSSSMLCHVVSITRLAARDDVVQDSLHEGVDEGGVGRRLQA